jgi:hypothetical protein
MGRIKVIVKGPCLIDGVSIKEIKAESFETLGILNCKFAYIISASGGTCGYGTWQMWSDGTVQKYKDLVESMEKDIVKSLFEADPTISSVSSERESTDDGVGGL